MLIVIGYNLSKLFTNQTDIAYYNYNNNVRTNLTYGPCDKNMYFPKYSNILRIDQIANIFV